MRKDHKTIEAIKGGAVRRDKKGRAFYMVPTSVRRNSQMIISDKTIAKLLKEESISKDDLLKIIQY